MYKLKYKDNNGIEQVKKYATKQEANYYKKELNIKGSKIVTDYMISDLSKHLLSEMPIVEAQTPLKALQEYLKIEGEDVKIKRDMSNTGRFVVKDFRSSYVFKVIV